MFGRKAKGIGLRRDADRGRQLFGSHLEELSMATGDLQKLNHCKKIRAQEWDPVGRRRYKFTITTTQRCCHVKLMHKW